MNEKIGRNDPCACGSGKKYKNCCLPKQQQKKSSLGGRKFTAKVLSGGGVNKPPVQQGQEQQQEQKEQAKAAIDYATLMERSFGSALHAHDDKPPMPSNPSQYLTPDESNPASNQ